MHIKNKQSSPENQTPNALRDAALSYAARGWPVFPLKPRGKLPVISKDRGGNGFKDATTDPATIEGWWAEYPNANIGIPTGSGTFTVIDVDGPEGEKSLATLEEQLGKLPPTLEQKSGRPDGGRHLLFMGFDLKSKADSLGPKLDTKGKGGYLVMTPSVHATGTVYAWQNGGPDQTPLSPMPAWVPDLINAAKKTGKTVDLAKGTEQEGKPFEHPRAGAPRFERVLGHYGILIPVNVTVRCPLHNHPDHNPSFRRDREESWVCNCSAGNVEGFIYRMEGGLKDFSDPAIWEKVWQVVAECGGTPPAPRYLTELRTDNGHGNMFADFTGGKMGYCFPWKTWLRWNDAYLEECVNGEEIGEAVRLVKYLWKLTDQIDDTDKRNVHVKANMALENVKKMEAMLKMAQHKLAVPVAELDTHPMLFNVGGKTIDLETGEVRAPRPEDMLTQTAQDLYDPEATCPKWIKFLDHIFAGDEKMIAFLQRAAGYSLTGSVVEQCLFILIGEGANGKTTFLQALLRAVGDYGRKVSAQTFLEKRSDSIPADLAALRGKRLAVAVEPEMNRSFAEALVKEATGGDTINARRLYQMPFEYDPQFKLWLATNRLPQIRGTDDGIWRRIRLVPFNVVIPKAQQDQKLEQKLRWEAAGILNWMLDGVKMWREDGLKEPDEVTDATAAYRKEQDVVGQFLTEMCVRTPEATCKPAALYGAYTQWCKGNAEEFISGKEWRPEMERRGLVHAKIKGERLWKGIGFKAKQEDRLD